MILIITSFVKYNKHINAIVFMLMLLHLHMFEAPGKAFDHGKWLMDVEYQEYDQ